MPVASAVSAAGNVLTTLINNASGKKAQERQHKYNKELLDKQLAINKDMAQYNYDNFQSPAAQLKGYRDAGINENLAYGQLSSGQTSAETPEVPQNEAYAYNVDGLAHGIDNAINMYYKVQNQEEQIKLLEAETESKNLDNALKKAVYDEKVAMMNNENAKKSYLAMRTLDYWKKVIEDGGLYGAESFLNPTAYNAKQKSELWKKQADWQASENSLNRLHQLDMQTIQMQDQMRKMIISHKYAKELKRMEQKHDLFKFNKNLDWQKGNAEAQLYLGIAKTVVDGLTSLGAGSLIKKGFKLFSKRK